MEADGETFWPVFFLGVIVAALFLRRTKSKKRSKRRARSTNAGLLHAFWQWLWSGDEDEGRPTVAPRSRARRKRAPVAQPGSGRRFLQWLWSGDEDEESADLQQLSPDAFEQVVARLYERMGYGVQRTQQTRDGGVDLYASRAHEVGEETIAVECKHYQQRTVGIVPVRSLYGVLTAQPHLTRGVLVTSGSFSRDCEEFAAGKRIDLVDGELLRELLTAHDLDTGLHRDVE